MFRKIMLLAVLTASFFASANSSKAVAPIPECSPCPWVR